MEVSRLSGMDNDLFTYNVEIASIPCNSVTDDDLEDETDDDMGWKEDGYCNGENLPGTYIIENQLHYQDYEWYETLDDCELKEEALRNKAIIDGVINNDEKYMMIKYPFNDDEEYVAVKEDEYDDLIMTRRDACQAYQEIFRIMDEGWIVTRETRSKGS
ncbi:hypothetical protein Tco_0332179 [Tanacetum coccineum]